MNAREWPPQVVDYIKTLDANYHQDPAAPRKPFWEGFTLNGGDDAVQMTIKRSTNQDIRKLGLYPTNVEDYVMVRDHHLRYYVTIYTQGL